MNAKTLVHLFVEPDHKGMGLGRKLLAQGEPMIVAGGHTEFELLASWTITLRSRSTRLLGGS